ncbi:alcohol oxidase [Agrocybe pediades]|nr:alcohol oxidase [Agrocybe pediades]
MRLSKTVATSLVVAGSSLATNAASSSFDYVVVGGGTAGLVVASRLTEDPSISVLVLEAGHSDSIDFNVTVPGLDLTVTGGSIVDWNYTTAPQQFLLNRTIAYPRGFVLGGSSSTNFMAYTRGAAAGYDAWAKLGNPGWDWKGVFPYFKKSTHFTPPFKNQSEVVFDITAYENPTGGPLELSYGGYIEPISIYFSQGLANTSGPNLQEGEINDGFPMGQAYLPLTVDPTHMTRSSSSASFLAVAAQRKNLQVITSALATRLLFAPTTPANPTPVVTGVEYSDVNGKLQQATATREVVLSAGTFGSPQLLMVSGIGPKKDLTAQNIPIRVQNEAVGQNMWDHLFFGPIYEVTENITTFNQFNANQTLFLKYLMQWRNNQGELSGAISSMSAYERIPSDVLANIPGGDQLEALDPTWPHIQLEVIAGGGPPTPQPGNFVAPAAVLLYPFSKGFVSLTSNSTKDKVIVQPNWLSSETDRQAAIWAFKQVREVMLSETLAPIVIREAFPGLQAQSDADILTAIQTVAHPIYQASGTCAMRQLSDEGVVDPTLKVYGVKNLRVIDASIMPIIPSANTMAPTYMIAEKGADLIKADQQNNSTSTTTSS